MRDPLAHAVRCGRLRVWRVRPDQWRHLLWLCEQRPDTHQRTRLNDHDAVRVNDILFVQEGTT